LIARKLLSNIKKVPWLAIILLVLTYGVFGWIFAQSIPHWSEWCWKHQGLVGLSLTKTAFFPIFRVIGLIVVLFIALILTTPSLLLNFLFGNWLKSDTKALLSVLGFAFAAVLIFCWLAQFVRLLVLISAAILLRFELQRVKYPIPLILVLIGVLCTTAFVVGLVI
jgi:hypothetical protein